MDLLEFEKIEGVIEPVMSKLGQLDGFIHCAEVDKVAPLKITTFGKVNEVFNINVLAGIEIARIISKKKNINPLGLHLLSLVQLWVVWEMFEKLPIVQAKHPLLEQ